MSTKIGGFNTSPVQVSTGSAVKRTEVSSGSSTATNVGSDISETNITASARTLAVLDQLAKNLPEIDQARVEQVSKRLADGSYKVNPERIADKLLLAEQALGQLK